jgi:hypothetical protein
MKPVPECYMTFILLAGVRIFLKLYSNKYKAHYEWKTIIASQPYES